MTEISVPSMQVSLYRHKLQMSTAALQNFYFSILAECSICAPNFLDVKSSRSFSMFLSHISHGFHLLAAYRAAELALSVARPNLIGCGATTGFEFLIAKVIGQVPTQVQQLRTLALIHLQYPTQT